VLSDPAEYDTLSDALTRAGIEMASSELAMIPDLITEVTDVDQARSILKFIDALEELDDVQDVYANFDISDEVALALDSE
jgi:transcriptional/translational regulatory protein YebC/TACO1